MVKHMSNYMIFSVKTENIPVNPLWYYKITAFPRPDSTFILTMKKVHNLYEKYAKNFIPTVN